MHVRANPYLCALAPTVRKYHPEPKNEDFLEMGDSWSALDGSVDSVRPAGTFVGHTNRLRCRYASRSLQKRDFWRRAGALSVLIFSPIKIFDDFDSHFPKLTS